jgi:hypothetical protein
MWYLFAFDFAALPPSFPDSDRSGPAVRTAWRARSDAAAVEEEAWAMLAWLRARAEDTPGSREGGGRCRGGWSVVDDTEEGWRF